MYFSSSYRLLMVVRRSVVTTKMAAEEEARLVSMVRVSAVESNQIMSAKAITVVVAVAPAVVRQPKPVSR